jgi:hypothetical protein
LRTIIGVQGFLQNEIWLDAPVSTGHQALGRHQQTINSKGKNMSSEILMGPVLSFRGLVGQTWRVTALVVGLEVSPPALELEGYVLVTSSVPVAHPNLSLVEGPLSFFASDNVTCGSADDLNDHWSHESHENERKRLVRSLVALGERTQCRVTLVSGDEHADLPGQHRGQRWLSQPSGCWWPNPAAGAGLPW